MLVKGIRSFSPDNNNVIEFYKPLTLIVGSNGAGKTTVIECLRQACTGEMPPNIGGNGRNWVMDPKVAGESEVKAQIKLRLRTSTQMPFVVVRSFQNVQKKATLQFKTLDATLQTYNKDTHAKEAVTYRCADINAMVPSLMGVSKAVLDNVIFVHQEESNWPLADGATIKKKFDEIFAATKYTKALETLRKLRLEKTQEVKEMRLKLDTLKSHKDMAASFSADIAAGSAKAERLHADIQQLQAAIDGHAVEVAAMDAKLDQIADVVDELSRLRAQLEVLSAAASEKLSRLDGGDFEESDAELDAFLQELKQTDAEGASRRESRVNELRVKQMDAASYEDRLQQAQQQLSRLQAAAEAHSSNVADRDAFLTATAAKLGIRLPGAAAAAAAGSEAGVVLPLAALDAFLGELRRRQAALQGEVVAMREAHRAQEADVAGRIDAANAELARAQQQGALKTADLRQLQARRDNLQQQVVAMSAVPYQAEELKLQEEDLCRRLEARKGEEARQDFEAQLAQQKAALERLAADMTALRGERDRFIMAGDAAGRARLASNALQAARDRLEGLLQGSAARQLIELAGNPQPLPHGAELKRLADAALRAREAEVKRKSTQLRDMEAELARRSGELASKRRQRVAAEARCQELRHELRRAVGSISMALDQPVLDALHGDDVETAYELAVQQLERVRNAAFRRMEKSSAFNNLLGMVLEDGQRECRCLVCNRAFANDEELAEMVSYVEEQRQELPARRTMYEQEIAELDRQLNGLNAHLADLAGLRELQGSMEATKAAEQQAQAQHDSQAEQVESLHEEANLLDVELTSLRRAVTDAGWSIAKQAAEVDDLKQQADAAAERAAQASGAQQLRQVEELDAELAELERQQRAADAAREDLNRRQGRIKDERMRLSEQLAAAREELRKAEQANRARLETQSQLKAADEQMGVLRSDIEAAKARVGPAQQARDGLLAQRDAMRATQLAAEGAKQAELKELSAAEEAYAAKQRLVEGYGAEQKEAQMAQLTQQLAELKDKRDACNREIVSLQQELDQSAAKVAENQNLVKTIEAVIDYRATKRQAEQLQQQIGTLTQQIGQVGDRNELQAGRAAAEEAAKEAQRQRDTKQGSLGVVLEQVKASKRSLADPKYAQIHARYRKQLIELKTTEMAAADLDKYHKALERALLAFHTGKMADINKIVKEMWQKTYRGQDIDYIQIKADAEGTARSYNYRVVMVNGGVELDMRGRCSAGQKVLACLSCGCQPTESHNLVDAHVCRVVMVNGGVELDMRGRCSAGQKVLACLIIRLALAETFCHNCGILALDEPTTNLDAGKGWRCGACMLGY
uniref:Rad50/SbcC-type AAA domain-containing protein n=1 Tax=Tetradesmus obliquus TaxID=3088 RepID=A0A383V2M5_TETOB